MDNSEMHRQERARQIISRRFEAPDKLLDFDMFALRRIVVILNLTSQTTLGLSGSTYPYGQLVSQVSCVLCYG
jgi:hypothetical protein